ncbi:hypothetical protein Q7C36_019812 [Tachysurus vachellii]|uniref:Uncharacterized protein n=1 Tax=Tachysurus vachellii TaxID=175792 RepID=A0AA88LSF9_TACVA|nr:hypothetical protein Q7C36_019812 [Tachysurus vachellii]
MRTRFKRTVQGNEASVLNSKNLITLDTKTQSRGLCWYEKSSKNVKPHAVVCYAEYVPSDSGNPVQSTSSRSRETSSNNRECLHGPNLSSFHRN